MLHCQLCSTRYTAVQIRNCSKSTSAIKVATMGNTDDFRYELREAIMCFNQIAVRKDEWDTKEDLGDTTWGGGAEGARSYRMKQCLFH